MPDFAYKVTFRVRHPTRAAVEIVSKLDLEPRFAWSVGEPKQYPNGKPRPGVWDATYCSFPMGEGDDGQVASFVEEALEDLAKHDAYLRDLRQSGGTFDFFIYWEADGMAGESFPADLLLKLGQLGIELQLDIYGPHCGPEDGWDCRQGQTTQ